MVLNGSVRPLKAVAPVQIRSGLRGKQQVKGLTVGYGGRALIIRHRFVIEPGRRQAAAGATE